MDNMERIMGEYGIKPFPDITSEAMAYVPYQPNGADTLDPLQGFEVGTMFKSLNKPFYGKKCRGDMND